MIEINKERIKQSFKNEPHFQITLSLPKRFKRDFKEILYADRCRAANAIESALLIATYGDLWPYDCETLYALELAITNAIQKEGKRK